MNAPAKKGVVIPSQAQLVAAVPASALTVKQLSDLAAQMMKLEDEIATDEAALAAKKERLRTYAVSMLPTAMDEAGVKAMELPGGVKVEVSDFLAANITQENRPGAFSWLRKNKLGAVIKNAIVVKFGKGDDGKVKKYVAFLKKAKIAFERKEEVHYQTLQALVRERMQAGKDLPPEINVVKVPTAVIKRPKAEE